MADGKIERFISGPDWKTDPEHIRQCMDRGKHLTILRGPAQSWSQRSASRRLGTPWPAQPVDSLRKKFSVPKTVNSARIYSTALGTYQLYLNGQRVGNDILAPGWTDYRKRVVYQVYDVTSQVQQGANRHRRDSRRRLVRRRPGLVAKSLQLWTAASPAAGAARSRIQRRHAR